MPVKSAPAPKGPALTFDPRYVGFVIEAWKQHGLDPMTLEAITAGVATYVEAALLRLNEMGLLEEDVHPIEITRVISLFKTLKLVKQATAGPKGNKVTTVSATSAGREVLSEPVAIGGIRPHFVRLLVASSPELTILIRALSQHGPLVRPVLSLTVGAPRKGQPYARAIQEGLSAFRVDFLPSHGNQGAAMEGPARATKSTPKQLVDGATAEALQRHPVGALKHLDKLVPLAEALGLLWQDTQQLNAVIAAQYIGAAATLIEGEYVPKAPAWAEIGAKFIDELIRAQRVREDSTGFATIQALRGALGRALHIAPSVADDLICRAHEAGERQEAAIAVHFEEDEEQKYLRGRTPLIWRGHAFDFVEVKSAVPAARR